MIMKPSPSTPLSELSGFAHANPALTMAGAGFPVSIFTGVLVPLQAMRFPRLFMSTIYLGVILILTRSAPIQIFQMIVIAIIITMQRPHSRRPLPYKDSQDETMNGHSGALPVPTQYNLPVRPSQPAISSPFGRFSLGQNLALDRASRIPSVRRRFPIQRSHPTVIRHFITRKTRYGQPSFIAIHNNELTRLHGVAAP